jgi:thymidine kinase
VKFSQDYIRRQKLSAKDVGTVMVSAEDNYIPRARAMHAWTPKAAVTV